MNSKDFTESVVEEASLQWLAGLDYQVVHGPDIAPGEPGAERDDYGQVALEGRLREALERLNPEVPQEALEDAFRKLTRHDSPSLAVNNHVVHKYLVEGVPIEYQRPDGSIGGDLVHVLDYDEPENTLLPPMALIVVYERIGKAILGQQKGNDAHTRTRAALRDTLLPKLISGQLRVPDAERIIGRAV